MLGRRSDGYHLLSSLFVPIDLADEVRVEIAEGSGVELSLHGETDGTPGDRYNLAVQAAAAFLDAAGLSRAVRLEIGKRIPAAAGLGGGSSDAGAVLRALQALAPDPLPEARLREVALALGADVPFFLAPRPALVSGIGERIEPVAALPALALVLVHPGIPLSTADVYERFDRTCAELTEARAEPTIPALSGLFGDGGRPQANALAGLLVNDLEAAAVRLCPAISELRERLVAAGALAVGLSGSGPTLFGVFPDGGKAREAEPRDWGDARVRSWLATTAAAP